MATNFPTSLDSWTAKVDGTDYPQAAHVNNLQDAVNALETKVGINSSAVTTTLDYKVAQLESGRALKTTTLTASTGLSGGGDLSANRSFSLANTAVTPGTYGSTSTIGKFTVDQQGRLTSASSETPSGTWGIEISGNAATATTAATVTGTNLGATVHYLTDMAATADWSKPAGYQTMVRASGSNNLPASHGQSYFGYTVTSRRDAGGGYSALLTAYDNSALWFTYQGDSTGAPVWRRVLSDYNYTDYTVTKTGSGASGTWGISITGNAATATSVSGTSSNGYGTRTSGTGAPSGGSSGDIHFQYT